MYAKDFGVVGDGVTDDAAAIAAAVAALRRSGPLSELHFEHGKTYYADPGAADALFVLDRCKGLRIYGENCRFVVEETKPYARLTNTKYCTLSGMTFDYAKKPAFTAQCAYVNVEAGTAVLVADRDIGMDSAAVYTPPSGIGGYFGVLDRQDARCHMYIKKYEMINRQKRTFRIYFEMTDANTARWLASDLMTYGMICPMPGAAHLATAERGFTVVGNYDLTLSLIRVNACYKFGMFISQNEGTLRLTDVDFVPADNALDRDMCFTSWRDAFHVKDNRCRILWESCDCVGSYDDILNVSSSALAVSDYDAASDTLFLRWEESGTGLYYPILPGDTLQVIDTVSGADCGTVTVTEVLSQSAGVNQVRIDRKLSDAAGDGTGWLAFFTNRCASESVIDNCDFSGTIRLRGPITVRNTRIVNYRIWLDVEGSREGPVPRRIHFKSCDILSLPGATVIVDSYCPRANGYHVEDIVFEDCVLDADTFVIGQYDRAYVSFLRCAGHTS